MQTTAPNAEAEQNYTCARWHLPESGIWELSMEAHYVAGKVMSWVVLDRNSDALFTRVASWLDSVTEER